MPLKSEGISKPKAFLLGTLSGAVEPIFGFLTVIITSTLISVLPYLLSFAAGAMIYVIVEELIPGKLSKYSNCRIDIRICCDDDFGCCVWLVKEMYIST